MEMNEMAHLNEMNPDIRAMRIRKIRERIKKGESLTDDEEKLYRESKHPRWG
jgi:anti-sigma28 factor (negative regulator of flagellin synthesis)